MNILLNFRFRWFWVAIVALVFTGSCNAQQPAVIEERAVEAEVTEPIMFAGMETEFGEQIPAIGRLHAHVIFVRFEGDNRDWWPWPSKPNPDDPTEVEDWMRDYINPSWNTVSDEYANISNYFREASLGKFMVTGDVLYTSIPDSFMNNHYGRANRFVIQKLFGDGDPESDIKAQIQKDLTPFDRWSSTRRGHHVAEPDSVLDYFIMIYRRPPGMSHPFGSSWHGIAGLGTAEFPVDNGYRVKGSGFNISGITQLFHRGALETFNMLIHEMAHNLVGFAHPYPGGSSIHPSYWGLFYTHIANQSINAFERERLGWSEATLLEEPSARITLGDYYTTGDAAKFRINDGEYLYFENRQKVQVSTGIEPTYDNATIRSDDKGMAVFRARVPYSTQQQNLIPIPADGYHNWEILGFSDACGSRFDQPVLRRTSQNPRGYSYRDIFTIRESARKNEELEQVVLFVHGENDEERCYSYMRGRDFDTTFNTEKGAKRYFTTWSNPPSSFKDGNPFGINFKIEEKQENELTVLFSEDPFFVEEYDELVISQDVFIWDVLEVPAETTLLLQEGMIIYMKEDSALELKGSLKLENSASIESGTYSKEQLRQIIPDRIKPLKVDLEFLEPATDL